MMAWTALSASPPPRRPTSSASSGRRGGEVTAEDLGRGLLVGPLDLDLHIEAAGTQDGGIDQILPVRGPDHDDVPQRFDPVDLGQQLRHDGRLHVGADAGATGAEERLHLVEEHDDRHALVGLLPGPLEDLPDLALRLAHVLVEELGALDVEEVAAHVGVAGRLGHLLGQRVGHGLGDEGLAAAGRAVEQDALGRRERVLGEELTVQVRQLDGVGDGLDLRVEPADVGVGDVGHLLEDEVLALELGQLLDQQLGADVHQQRVATAQLDVEHLLGELGHALLVGPGEDDAAALVLELLLEGDHLAGELPVPDEDHVQRLVQHDLVALADLRRGRCRGGG